MLSLAKNERIILDHQLVAILILNQRLEICYANHAAEQLIGLSAKRIHHIPLMNLLQHERLSKQELSERLLSQHSFTENDLHIDIDQQASRVDLSVNHLQIDGQTYICLNIKEVAQQQRISQERYQQQQQVAAKELIRGLAHEIKNPLGGLRGAAQLLERELSNPEHHEYTSMIIEQADRLRNLVDRLLGAQRPGQRSVQNIHHVLEKVLQLLEINLPVNLQILRDYDPSLPELEMDDEQMQQAFLNIIQNAIQALEQQGGKVRIKTRTAHQVVINGRSSKLALEVSITDNGPGIPEALRDTLFYPMVTGRDEGTGLGLSIAQDIFAQHHGKVECNSTPGNTEFIIHIPIQS